MKSDKIRIGDIESLKKLETYNFISSEFIEELASEAVLMEHKKTKARLFLLLNDDDNKVFAVGLRTPAPDSTGTAHIIEHSVLCGSRKFPCKDPFVELVKGSLNTFLNALTYPDKTVYPVASCNDKDFKNLMDVYLDAVFYPNIYKEEKIFKQEGWHYELETKEGPLTINGVVYNEMKGVFSSADETLDRAVSKTLFEGHSYGEESGGDPDRIPELTYKAFLEFHSLYYHPSNSFIYLYGDMNMEERLIWLDREYLSKFDYKEVDSAIKPVKKWDNNTLISKEYNYSILESQSMENATYLSLHTVVGGELEPEKYMAFKILEYVLLNVPGAVLREALIDAGIGEDIYGGYNYGISEPYFSVIAKNSDASRKEEFLAVIKGVLRKLADEGLDKEVLRAAVNIYEFKAREADFGSYPKGLIYGLSSFDSWLYGGSPLIHLKYSKVFEKLKSGIDSGYFEQLIKDCLLDNAYEAFIMLSPKKELTKQKEEELAKKLKQLKAGLSEREIENIIEETKELKRYQSEPSKPEDLLKIPMLTRSDIKKEADRPVWAVKEIKLKAAGSDAAAENKYNIIHSDIFTSGIAYIKFMFSADDMNEKELLYLSLLKEVLGYIDTESYTYSSLSTEINLNSGGIWFSLDPYSIESEDLNKNDDIRIIFSVNSKILYDKYAWLGGIVPEILLNSKLNDKKRLKDIVLEVKARVKERLLGAGHITALTRAGSHISKLSYFNDIIKGIRYYAFLDSLSSDFEAQSDELVNMLKGLSSRIFNTDNLSFHITCDDDKHFIKTLEAVNKLLPGALVKNDGKLSAGKSENKSSLKFTKDFEREAFTSASMVNYVARVGSFKAHGFDYTGVLRVLKVLLSYDYLWNNVRVKGGAYGCFAMFLRNGSSGFSSYRDPNVQKTDDIYKKTIDFVKNFDADEREMTKAVIGAISDLDAVLTPYLKGLKGLNSYLSGIDFELLQKEREQVLSTKSADIRALAGIIEAVLSDNVICAVGNEGLIKKEAAIFDSIKELY